MQPNGDHLSNIRTGEYTELVSVSANWAVLFKLFQAGKRPQVN